MATDGPLPPHYEQFIRDQLAAGRFRSEGDVIRTALRLLEEQAQTRASVQVWLKQELDKGLGSRPGGPATKEYWDHHRTRVRAAATPAHDA